MASSLKSLWPGATGVHVCPDCGSRRLDAQERSCAMCRSRAPAIYVLSQAQFPRKEFRLPAGVQPWADARGHWECSRCRARRQLDANDAMHPAPCHRCNTRHFPCFVLAAHQPVRPAQPTAQASLEVRKARVRQARADEAARLLGRLLAEVAGERFDWWQRPPAAEVTFDDDLLDGSLSAEKIVNRHVARHHYGELSERASQELSLPKEGFTARRAKGGMLILRGEVKMMLIQATRVRLYLTNKVEVGNFLTAGSHWRSLKPVLRRVSSTPNFELRTETVELGALTLVRDWPDSATLTQAEDSTTRIRHDRRRAFGHPMVFHLLTTGATLRLDPVRRVDGALGVPFSYRATNSATEIIGVLRVRSPNPVLPIEVPDDHAREHLHDAWLATLTVFADLTAGGEPEGPAEPRMPESFTATPATAEILGHFVIGHRRRERPTFEPSKERRNSAAEHGIGLPALGYTWVRPHLRGTPPDEPLEFQFHPSSTGT